ncbi:uncharacterized protein KGF55_000898 [Candida pseudojiufengensis]|uniref:uncharacterized protein n=1 Tax=Candida pseudojiufengensis TaxID=497109 RepID=UPI0022246F7A|nr:uncharacterized protein KGF55_000898 [Candida pseudojiufengensis]KAI5966588.1 hypothetical protein KGF55_000898 [Candida pseudojiufengensis]
MQIETNFSGEDTPEEIEENNSQDEQAFEIYYYLSNQIDPLNTIKYTIKKFNYKNGVLYYKGFDYRADPFERIWIAFNLHYKIINIHHSPNTTLHPGAEVTYLERFKFNCLSNTILIHIIWFNRILRSLSYSETYCRQYSYI